MFRVRFAFLIFTLAISSMIPTYLSASIVGLDLVGSWSGSIISIDVCDDYVYVLDKSGARLTVLDASDPSSITALDSLSLGGGYTEILVEESGGQRWGYLNGSSTPVTLNLTDPHAMSVWHTWATAFRILAVDTTLVYGWVRYFVPIGKWEHDFVIFDTSNSTDPQELSRAPLDTWGWAWTRNGDRFYFAGETTLCAFYDWYNFELEMFDVSNPNAPGQNGSINLCCPIEPCFHGAPDRLIASDNWLVVVNYAWDVYNLTAPQNPVTINPLPQNAFLLDSEIEDPILFCLTTAALHVLDVSVPTQPVELTSKLMSMKGFVKRGNKIYVWRNDRLDVFEPVTCPPGTESEWIRQASGTTKPLYGVSFTDAMTGTAVGEMGTIIRTTDGGNIWTSQTSGTNEHLMDVSFTEAMTGTAVGYTGTILRTTDGGSSWTPQTSGTTSWLRGVWFTDAMTGTAVGQSGTILRTTDGGAAWVLQTSGITDHLIGVYLTDAMTATAVGNRGTILNTTDGGDTWVPQTSGTQVQLRNVWFDDVTTGTAVGEAGTILRTVDGGSTWAPQTSVAASWLGAVSFTDAATGLAVGAGGVMLRTTDGGDTWNCEASGVTNEINGVLYIDDETAVAVGDHGIILRWEEDIFTPVLITAFYAKPVEDGIELNWSLFADERVDGFRIYRSGRDETSDRLLNTQRLAGTSRRYVDLTALPGERYRYTLAVLASESGEIRSAPVMAERPPLATQLFQNRPNPFNPNTSIRYTISKASFVSLRVYSTSGELVRKLVDQRVPSGLQEVIWDGTNDAGSPVASGVYVYRLRASNVTRSKKMVLLK